MSVTKKESSAKKRHTISKKQISERLVDIDIAQTSAIRDLEMDVSGSTGADSSKVIAAARKALS